MTDAVTDTWLVGVVAHDDALSGVRVHAGYVAAGPTSGRDHRIQVRLRFASGGGSGFPDPDASAELLDTEDRLVEALGDDAALVAVLTVPGFRDLVFHTAEAGWATAVVVETLGDPAGPDDVDAVADPAWSRYRSLFADAVPADADRRRISEVAARADESAPRCPVAHRFSFPGLAEADRAAAALRDVGLEVVFEAADDTNEAAPPRFSVTETEVLTQVDMARSRDALGGFAAGWGGDYLGWTTPTP